MHKEAYEASQRRENSCFEREEEKKVTMLKNEVYFKVFKAIYWLAKEEIASTKITSLLELIEKMGVDDLKYFQTRSEPVLRKMLLLKKNNNSRHSCKNKNICLWIIDR